MTWCIRHTRLLEDAIDLRGIDRECVEFDAMADAQQRIITHATHLAGAAAITMLAAVGCPLCFVNQNPARANCDGWIDCAADETSAADLARRNAATDVRSQLIVT